MTVPRFLPALWLLTVIGTVGCGRDSPFSVPNAERHVRTLAGEIGVRVAGTEAARRAREYLKAELARYGFAVRVEHALGSRPEFGLSVETDNIIAVKDGSRSEAIALVAHYDSPPDSRGAADDGLGAAVLVEAGRALAMRPSPRWSLVIAITDAEEYGLLGATALIRDPVWSRVRAYLNFEAVGSASPVLLFQTGPGNAWLTRAWARHAPWPAGSSVGTEIYKRMPNDTDFTILARTGVPGLNFASVGDSYTYHTSRDVPERLSASALWQAGAGTIAIVEGLEATDITARSPEPRDYLAVHGLAAFVLPPASYLTLLAVTLALVAWVLVGRRLIRETGWLAAILPALWVVAGVAAISGAMLAAAASLRAVAPTLHPWYAHPWRTFVCLILSAAVGGWIVARLRAALPAVARGASHPLVVWLVTFPAWIAVAVAAWRLVPGAAFLATVPLGASALLVLAAMAARARPVAIRIASSLALLVTSAVWFEIVTSVFGLAIPIVGRLQTIAPLVAWPAMIGVALFWLAPPFIAAVAGLVSSRQAVGWVTVGLLVATGAAWVRAWRAPSYTAERPQYRSARYVHDPIRSLAAIELTGSEGRPSPTEELKPGAPRGWRLVDTDLEASVSLGRARAAFVYRAPAEPVPAPVTVSAREAIDQEGRHVEVVIVPTRPLFSVALVLPPGIVPADSSLPGTMSGECWRAALASPQAAETTIRFSIAPGQDAPLDAMRLVATTAGLPGGTGWQGLPPWLPAETSTWTARSVFVLPVPISRGP